MQGAGHTPGRLSRKINKYKATDAECQDSECWGIVSPLSGLGGCSLHTPHLDASRPHCPSS